MNTYFLSRARQAVASIRRLSLVLAIAGDAAPSTASGAPSTSGPYNTTAKLLGMLTHSRVACFDVDAFLAGDGVVMIGHPGKEAIRCVGVGALY